MPRRQEGPRQVPRGGCKPRHPLLLYRHFGRPIARSRFGIVFKRIVVENSHYRCTIPPRRSMAGDMQITCSDCGQEFTFTAADQAFFQERGYSTPKRCRNCRQARKNDQGGSGYRSAPSQGTPVICSGCGQPTTVPFEPRGDRPVFCRDCYVARKGSGSPRGRDRR
ncbi:MAG: zinc-ribbon domain containing protein [Terracidiphilus sp.]